MREQVLQADLTLRPLVVTGDSNLDHQPVQWLSAVVSLLDKPALLHKSLRELAQRLGRRWSARQLARLGQAYLAAADASGTLEQTPQRLARPAT